MSNQVEKTPQVVYIVTCYQNVVGVYACQEDASVAQLDLIQRNRPADILCRSVIEPLNVKK